MRSHLLVGAAALVSICSVAVAGEPFAEAAYGYPGGGYGFADGAVNGAYIGAPFTYFPRPGAIVPPAWGYGTYGIPTATGIRQAPIGDPKIYVVRGVGPTIRRGRTRSWSDPSAGIEAAPRGPRVVTVTARRR